MKGVNQHKQGRCHVMPWKCHHHLRIVVLNLWWWFPAMGSLRRVLLWPNLVLFPMSFNFLSIRPLKLNLSSNCICIYPYYLANKTNLEGKKRSCFWLTDCCRRLLFWLEWLPLLLLPSSLQLLAPKFLLVFCFDSMHPSKVGKAIYSLTMAPFPPRNGGKMNTWGT